jgi:SNF2 family DNA or RNA helicase
MIELNTHRYKFKPFAHQLEGVRKLVEMPAFFIGDEMGLGKSKQVIDAACELYELGKIDLVLIVCPKAAVNGVWLDKDFGEIMTHTWVPWVSYVYHTRGLIKVSQSQPEAPRLGFVVTNYETLRKVVRVKRRKTYPRVGELAKLIKKRRVLFVVDESSYCAYPDSAQTRATYALRQHCDRVVELNGTPVSNSPLSLYPQFKILDPSIIGCRTKTEYVAKYCQVDIYGNARHYANAPELMKKTAPYVLRRMKSDCLDLPDKLYTRQEVTLTEHTWRLYKDMRDNMIAWLDQETAMVAAQAVVKVLRLLQLTSGIMGGVEGQDVEVISHEKRDFLVDFIKGELPNQGRIIVWNHFRLEQEHLAQRLRAEGITTYRIYGGQHPNEREEAIRKFSRVSPYPSNGTQGAETSVGSDSNHAVLLGQSRAGGIGLNLVAAALAIYCSNSYSHVVRKQSEDRIHRLGQSRPCTIMDVLAVGPKGERTMDHQVLRALLHKEDLERWTTEQWKEALAAA